MIESKEERRHTIRMLGRLRIECRDWCRNQPTSDSVPPTTHTETVNGVPEVWDG
jgi:hypothetical protein